MSILPQMITYLRGQDRHGSGAYGASRDGGRRVHKGVDIAFQVAARMSGTVTKIGYPYSQNDLDKAHFRYVEVTDEAGFRLRYFYVSPTVEIHQIVERGDPLGFPQDLTGIYPGITPHCHFEVINLDGEYVDPIAYLEDV